MPPASIARGVRGRREARSPSLRGSAEVTDNRGGSRPHVRRRGFAARPAATRRRPLRTTRPPASISCSRPGSTSISPAATTARCRCGRASSSSIAPTPAPGPTSNGPAAPSPSGSAWPRPRAAAAADLRRRELGRRRATPARSRPIAEPGVLVVSGALAARLAPPPVDRDRARAAPRPDARRPRRDAPGRARPAGRRRRRAALRRRLHGRGARSPGRLRQRRRRRDARRPPTAGAAEVALHDARAGLRRPPLRRRAAGPGADPGRRSAAAGGRCAASHGSSAPGRSSRRCSRPVAGGRRGGAGSP